MLRSYVAAGFDPAAFWELTPRLYLIHMMGSRDRMENEQSKLAWLAWHIAGLQRMKDLPDPQRFISGTLASTQRQSPEQLQAMCNALAAAWGAK